MILVDSSVWIDYFNGAESAPTNLLDRLLGTEPIAIGDLILAEVLRGFSDDRSFNTARKVLAAFIPIEIGGHDIAVKAANHFRSLRARGLTVSKTIDTLIATRCIEEGHVLLHDDRDFDPFVKHLGLQVAR